VAQWATTCNHSYGRTPQSTFEMQAVKFKDTRTILASSCWPWPIDICPASKRRGSLLVQVLCACISPFYPELNGWVWILLCGRTLRTIRGPELRSLRLQCNCPRPIRCHHATHRRRARRGSCPSPLTLRTSPPLPPPSSNYTSGAIGAIGHRCRLAENDPSGPQALLREGGAYDSGLVAMVVIDNNGKSLCSGSQPAGANYHD
jgi:hypothetical protein